jgi:hypothetical protein
VPQPSLGVVQPALTAAVAPVETVAQVTTISLDVALTAPPLVVRAPPARPIPPPKVQSHGGADDARRAALRLAATQPASYPMPAREAIIGDGQGVAEPSTAPTPPPPAAVSAPDRWQALRDALAGCGSEPGLLAQSVCAERARLDHCGSYWGHVALCPVARHPDR